MAYFPPYDDKRSIPASEEEVLEFWKKHDIFQRSIDQRPNERRYVFYDGPPFATGLPHYGHLVASTIKDIVPRYWTMRGYRVERRFGWDTHGLPIEMDVEKKLDLKGPREIRAYGVAKFNEECRSGVLRYVKEWEQTITRIGRWVSFKNDYKTMDRSFMESVWWVFRQLWDKGLVYQGQRVTPFSWRLSTPLSNFEAGLDYRDVDDPAVTVRLELVDKPNEYLLIWTTTPWTLPSNLAVAVGEDIPYALVEFEGHRYWVAKARIEATFRHSNLPVLEERLGRELVGRRYKPLFPFFENHPKAFQVLTSPHVSIEDGTGLVHMSPAYGEDDFEACKRMGITPVDPVDDEGNFTAAVPPYAGRNVKEADKHILKDLKAQGSILRHDTIRHAYPYCWRSGTPLIYKTSPSWYVRASTLRERMVAHNAQIHWVPEFVGQGRFSNWLAEARDWSVSRNRFWGTPLPIWVSEDGKDHVCVGSLEELTRYTGVVPEGLHPHEIDHLPFVKDGRTYRRIPDVFDCWFESGSMPYAQVHYPFENRAEFERDFPANFIAEGLDQTRGWFYTLVVLSSAIFDRPAFRNVVVNGLVLAEDGTKMSKSKKNYPDPSVVLDSYGADALRAYLVSSPVVRGEPLRFSETGIKEVVRSVMLPLQNALSFFVTYANLEDGGRGFNPELPGPAPSERSDLDRWILSVLQTLIGEVNREMEGYYLHRTVPPMLAFIDDLTNWYIRRSRRRFWRSEADTDKASAYFTLYEVLTTFAKVLAPIMPFMSERMYRTLLPKDPTTSVHLTDYPQVQESLIDRELETDFEIVRTVVRLGRTLRERHKLKNRQPLRAVTVVSHDDKVRERLQRQSALILDELNVKEQRLVADDTALATLTFRPNFKTLGKRLGAKLKSVGAAIEAMDRSLWEKLDRGESIELAGAELTRDDVLVSRAAREGVVVESEGALTVALDTTLDATLLREGIVREALRALQQARAATPALEVSHRIDLALATMDDELREVLTAEERLVREEALVQGTYAVGGTLPQAQSGFTVHEVAVDTRPLTIAIRRVGA